MKKLIELFNKKYGATYGIIDDSIDNEDVYKVYKIIKSLCSDDNEIMDMLNKIKLPNPRTASESIEKINAEHVSGEGLDDLIKYVNDNLPHYNETLVFEISGEDFKYYANNSYFNMDALNIDETKLYVGKEKFDINSDEEYDYKFVYDKETGALINEISPLYIYNHKSYDGTNFVKNENSAVLSHYVAPMLQQFDGEGYFRLYEIDKFELDDKYLPDDLNIKNSLTVGERKGNIGMYSVAEGSGNVASGFFSHAEGEDTIASGSDSHAEGYNTTASGYHSHAEGNGAVASGSYSHAEGFFTIASDYQHVQGKFNKEDTEKKYAHIVGNGTSRSTRSNAHTLDWNGNGWYKGKLSQDGTPTEDRDLATKKYVDDKTEILPVKNNYIIFEDAVPRLMEDIPTYGTGGSGGGMNNNTYIFDNLQNADMIVHSAKFNLIISFNDGTENITKNINVNVNGQTGFTKYVDDYFVMLEYNEDTNLIMVTVVKGVQTDDGYNQIPCTVTKATFICILYSGLLTSNVIENIEYKKITNVPTELQYLTNGQNETLKSKEYYDLYDNSFVWDMNKINERLDENFGVTQNTFSTTYSGKVINVNQKDSEGIGFGQLVPIKRDKNVAIFVRAEKNVIIKVYNPNTKELIFTMEDIYINSFRYAKYSIPFHKVRDIDNIFIAFTIKDTPTDSFSNNRILDLMVIDESTFLKKKEILTKTNTEEYHPTGDYNPATKKYVDERTFSREVVTVNNVNDSLTLTTDKNQYATLAVPVEIILPTVTSFTELHLFFNGSEGVTIGTTNVKWESQVTIENNKSYEIIFTYVNESIGWLGKTIVYS